MKNRHAYGVLLLALLFCGSVSAKVDNYMGGYAQVGEWSMLPSGSKYTASIGAAGGVGFLYELRAGKTNSQTRFLFDAGVGAWGGMTSFMQSSDITEPLLNQKDLQGNDFDYVYELKGRRDRYNNVAVQIPLLFGVQHKRFYMLAGAKFTANVWTQNQTVATLNTYGDYTNHGYPEGLFIGKETPMPQYQFFKDKAVSDGVKTSLNIDVDLSLEIGARIGGVVTDAVGFDVPKDRVEYRLAVFADYGLLDLHTKGSNNMMSYPSLYDINKESDNYVYQTETMISQKNGFHMNDIMSTSNFANVVNNLMVGVKFTILFQIPEPGQCVICRDAYGSSVGSGSVRRGGVKYEE